MLEVLVSDVQACPAPANPALVIGAGQPLKRAMRAVASAPNSDSSPEELISAVAERRDRKAFIGLFERFAPRIKAYLMRQGADPATAEDLAQDVMLTVWRRAEQFDRRKASVSTWIFTIARNRRIDVLRRTRRPEIDPDDPLLVREPETAPDSHVESLQSNARLHAAVAKLPTEQQKLLRLVYFEDKSHSVIAAELSLPLGTVKSRLRLAMAKLRAALESQE